MGRYKEAIDFANKAISLDPSYSEAYYRRGISYLELGNIDEAK
jgi:Flp pilus assembly protein TadD